MPQRAFATAFRLIFAAIFTHTQPTFQRHFHYAFAAPCCLPPITLVFMLASARLRRAAFDDDVIDAARPIFAAYMLLMLMLFR